MPPLKACSLFMKYGNSAYRDVLGITKSRIASGGVINRTAKSIQCADIVPMRRRITQPGCPKVRRIAEGIAVAHAYAAVPFFVSTCDDWKRCPLLAKADMSFVLMNVRFWLMLTPN